MRQVRKPVLYRSAGRTGEAIAIEERVAAGRERVLGPGHPDGRVAVHSYVHERQCGGSLEMQISLNGLGTGLGICGSEGHDLEAVDELPSSATGDPAAKVGRQTPVDAVL
jgi:Tetratricopeptide repeat